MNPQREPTAAAPTEHAQCRARRAEAMDPSGRSPHCYICNELTRSYELTCELPCDQSSSVMISKARTPHDTKGVAQPTGKQTSGQYSQKTEATRPTLLTPGLSPVRPAENLQSRCDGLHPRSDSTARLLSAILSDVLRGDRGGNNGPSRGHFLLPAPIAVMVMAGVAPMPVMTVTPARKPLANADVSLAPFAATFRSCTTVTIPIAALHSA